MIAGRIALLCAMAAVASSGAQSTVRGMYAIDPEQVVQALAGQGIQVAAGQVILVADVVASRPNPALEVLGFASKTGDGAPRRTRRETWVKLGCRNSGTCLPFYARVAMGTQTSLIVPRPHGRNVETAHRAAREGGAPVMRAGTHAILVLAGPESRIELAVISLERGAMGRTIRVATPDYKRFYRAEVVGADRLKGSF